MTFWSLPPRARGSDPTVPLAFNAEHWRISNARDVIEVLDWARSDGRLFEVFAESADAAADRAFTKTVLRLAGYNLAYGPGYDPTAFLSVPADLQTTTAQLEQSREK
ncbi:hypothetical protein D7I44_08420 [Gryllotalpicola protaetiae]|uniref:Uncharacterized protein n=1 Tax=Gryllotalpicola protaetiae TaxID=2419771 RepID=A0A387BNF3_9MICO|nr:hypothetical protein D7I44_08420 [Gryllotalpicola protaetiae]